jgi:hypothetical protein
VKPSALEFFQVLSSGEFEEGKEKWREENASAHLQKTNAPTTCGSGLWKEMGFPN